ncbi:MAG: NAD(P)H-hydrate epimerase [Planctomycetales bacterium]|nr:NAD(P)H-hydrate epimerase [Planctomycetales bacterium]
MTPLSRDAVRDIDRRAIAELGLPGVVLMENAGRGAAELLLRLGMRGPVVICCGKGNNGGDGFVIARHLDLHGVATRVLLFCEPADVTGDAAINLRVLQAAKFDLRLLSATPDATELARELAAADWIVDALLGTGTRGDIREPYVTAINAINAVHARGVKVFAVDLPSGLDCDTGHPLGPCVEADHTATFVAPKLGFVAPGASKFTGQVHVIDIGVPRTLVDGGV